MNCFSGFTTSHHAMLTWREFTVILKKRNLAMLKMTQKPLIVGFIISSQYWLNICIYTIILIRTSQKSKTRVFYLTFHNNDFAFLWDCYKVFSLSKNNFLDNFSFIANWKWFFSSFFRDKQTSLAPKLIISTRARVSENWQWTVDYQKWSSLGSEVTTFIDGILSKLSFQWVKKGSVYIIFLFETEWRSTTWFTVDLQFCHLGKWEKKS